MTQPKVSIIIPVYGVEKYLRQCLDSVINQTLQDIEIILIDDGGKDNCPQIIDEYAAKDNRIKAIHKPNGGYGHSCNRGLTEATGEYIGIVEPDDYIDKNMYKALYNLAITDDADIVKSSFCKNYDCEERKEIVKVYWNKHNDIPSGSFKIEEYPDFLYFHPSIWSCIYKREFLNSNNIRFVEAPGAGWTDNPFQVQTMCLAKKIIFTDNAYYYWRCTNIDQSDDLKDYTLPFKRSDEIHTWLKEKDITNPEILEALYRRELAYLHIVLRMQNITNPEDCFNLITKMCNRMHSDIIENSDKINSKNKKFLKICKLNPKSIRTKFKIKNLRKKIISLSWNSHEKHLKIFGKTILRKGNNKCKQ